MTRSDGWPSLSDAEVGLTLRSLAQTATPRTGPHAISFAEQVGCSTEMLRKIEGGQHAPSANSPN